MNINTVSQLVWKMAITTAIDTWRFVLFQRYDKALLFNQPDTRKIISILIISITISIVLEQTL